MVLSDKKYLIFALLVSLLGLGIFMYEPDGNRANKVEQVAFFEDTSGDVSVRNQGDFNYKGSEPGDSLQSGDYILTKDGVREVGEVAVVTDTRPSLVGLDRQPCREV